MASNRSGDVSQSADREEVQRRHHGSGRGSGGAAELVEVVMRFVRESESGERQLVEATLGPELMCAGDFRGVLFDTPASALRGEVVEENADPRSFHVEIRPGAVDLHGQLVRDSCVWCNGRLVCIDLPDLLR